MTTRPTPQRRWLLPFSVLQTVSYFFSAVKRSLPYFAASHKFLHQIYRFFCCDVRTAGFIGFAMGATSNAMANMQVVTKKYGPSPVAYFAIPMVGGMFIDFFNAVLISANISWWA